MVKKLLATLLASVIGVGGIACIDNEARVMIDENSKQIKAYYSEYKEDFSNLEESITECTHNCKDYTHLEEQYEDLSVKYNELSLWCEENKEKEYKVGDIIEIPVYCYGVKIDTLQCYVEILEINPLSLKSKYKIRLTFLGYFNTKKMAGNDPYPHHFRVYDDYGSGFRSSINITPDGRSYPGEMLNFKDFSVSNIVLENDGLVFDIT